ncbi:MAG: hypothetical protein ACRD2W_22170 [Acidimicrobiales bacterium]
MTIERLDWIGTVAFAVTAALAAVAPSDASEAVAFAVAVVLFAAGAVAFALAFARAVGRSRIELIGVGPLFFLTGGIAPPAVRRHLLGAFAVQVVVALATAIARPYSSLAAGTLVPLYGLGLCGLWAARHATFPKREA